MADDTKPKARKAASDAGAAPRKKAKLSAEIVKDESEYESDDEVKPKAAAASKGKGKAAPKAEPQKKRTYKKRAPQVKTEVKVQNDAKPKQSIPLKKKDVTQFGWKSCSDESPVMRLEIKEEAVRQGLRHGDKVGSVLRQMLNAAEGQMEVSEASSSVSDIQGWLKQFDDVKTHHSNFRVFIGFAGVTGAGKTSAINSIIGFRDLLPSSNESAATAVPCLIEYNDDHQHAFRAEVKFQEKDDIKKELDQYFESIQQLAARAADDGEQAETDASLLLDVGEDDEEDDNQDLLEMVSAVFGLDEDELNKETTNSVLSKNPTVLQLLGETISIEENDVEVFSEKIKPYMDSVTADHGDNGHEFAAWPLIKEVKIFVRSDVLRNGIVLVDLPGLADNVESRATVAREYFRKLSVTAIVTPIIRARNEQTGVQLMTQNQQLSMQMDGKYHKNSFCVLLSKMDDINANTYLKQHSVEAKSDLGLQGWLAQYHLLRTEFANLKRAKKEQTQSIKGIEDGIAKIQAADDAETVAGKQKLGVLREQKTDAITQNYELDMLMNKNTEQSKRLDARILHWCIQQRNSLVKGEIQQDFAKRQKRLLISSKKQDLYDGNVSIFPISASAFWKVKEDREKPNGFPTAQYTGVPAFTHWLRYATVPDREKHLDRVLNTLQGLFIMMNTWSCNEKTKLELTREFVEAEVLQKPLLKLQKALNPAFIGIRKEISALDPMKNKSTIIGNCREKCVEVVQKWSRKDPNGPKSTANRMQWGTYHACVRRKGMPYRSHAQGRPRYAWIESLCNLFYEGIVSEWNLALNEEIPALEKPALRMMDTIWATFLQQLQDRVRVAAPEIEGLFQKEQGSFEQIKDLINDSIAKKFDAIRVGAQKIHRNITKSVQKKFDPAFRRAAQEHGRGMYLRQKRIMVGQANLRGQNMFKDSAEDIDKQLKAQLNSLKKQFDEVIAEALSRVRQHVRVMLDNASKTQHDDESVVQLAPKSKERAQKTMRRILSEWAAHWRIGDFVDLTIETMDMAIPSRYYEADEDDVDQDEAVKDQAIDNKVIEEEAVGDRAVEKEVVEKEAVETGEPKDSVASKGEQEEGEQMVTDE